MDWIAIVLAGASTLVVGAIYYHPKVLGTVWMKAAGLTEEDLKGANMALILGGAFLCACLMAMSISFIVPAVHASEGGHTHGTFGHGSLHGIINALTLAMPIIVINGLFERKSAKYNLVHLGYWVIAMAVMGGILDMMHG